MYVHINFCSIRYPKTQWLKYERYLFFSHIVVQRHAELAEKLSSTRLFRDTVLLTYGSTINIDIFFTYKVEADHFIFPFYL